MSLTFNSGSSVFCLGFHTRQRVLLSFLLLNHSYIFILFWCSLYWEPEPGLFLQFTLQGVFMPNEMKPKTGNRPKLWKYIFCDSHSTQLNLRLVCMYIANLKTLWAPINEQVRSSVYFIKCSNNSFKLLCYYRLEVFFCFLSLAFTVEVKCSRGMK